MTHLLFQMLEYFLNSVLAIVFYMHCYLNLLSMMYERFINSMRIFISFVHLVSLAYEAIAN